MNDTKPISKEAINSFLSMQSKDVKNLCHSFQSQVNHFGDINEANKSFSFNTRENFQTFCQDLRVRFYWEGFLDIEELIES